MMRAIAADPAARGLTDDVAVLEIGGQALIVTHDIMAEGVHWPTDADPADVAWKLVAANLSDLASKGAEPIGVLLGFCLGNNDWDARFANGLQEVLDRFDVPLLGGDTLSFIDRAAPKTLGMTALGRASYRPVPARCGAVAGDVLYVTGTLGDASAGFSCLMSQAPATPFLLNAFNRPVPLLKEGRALAPCVRAMMDVSDGLLLDARRMADASGLAVLIDMATIPLSPDYQTLRGNDLASRLDAASWGDDYQLLFAAAAGTSLPVEATAIGHFTKGTGVSLSYNGQLVPLPATLGFEHR
jgi:thiamine-monophosphate kinase